VYLIAPLQAALYLGQTEAWQALLVNLTGFGLVTALRVSRARRLGVGAFAQETLLLAFVGAPLVDAGPVRHQVQAAEHVGTGGGRRPHGKVQDAELWTSCGYLGASVNRTTGAIAGGYVSSKHQSPGPRGPWPSKLAASAQELQAASSRNLQRSGTRLQKARPRQRQLIGHGRKDSEAGRDVAAQLHARAQEASARSPAWPAGGSAWPGDRGRANCLRDPVDHTRPRCPSAAGTLEPGLAARSASLGVMRSNARHRQSDAARP